ncbi:hypothetical protein AURDEDRAFT_160979 [Auricularia subglabra TFB-10046 SS5]|nr:hypothetical protein AURDEDRAFT_160979 [Auricularia subglabra TFB-10046 SS5]
MLQEDDDQALAVRKDEYRQRLPARADPARPEIGKEMRANQHLRRFYHVFEEEGLIAIANVLYMPQLPPPQSTKRLRVDGRYGPHEETLNAQMHMPGRWHMALCPAPQSAHSNLNQDMAWYEVDFDEHLFEVRAGLYKTDHPLQGALRRAAKVQSAEFSYTTTSAPGAPYLAEVIMNSAVNHLCKHLMTKEEVLWQMAQFQRSVLELRAWSKYEKALAVHRSLVRRLAADWASVLRPADHTEISKDDRGVFVTTKEAANIYGHLQVPVWWLRGYSDELLEELKRWGLTEIPELQRSPFYQADVVPAAADERGTAGLYDAQAQQVERRSASAGGS